jgi:anti-anti-sigma factor
MSELATPELFEIEIARGERRGAERLAEPSHDTEPSAPKPIARFVAQTRPSQMTIALEGEIGVREYEEIAEQLFRFSSRGVRRVVLDFSDVSHLDYRVVRPLMLRASGLRHLGGDIKLCGLSPYIHAIFRSAGANDAFDYYAEAEDAVTAFTGAVFTAG